MTTTQTQTVPVSAKTLATLFETSYFVFGKNTAGITHEESVELPQPAGNSANWIAGHLVDARLSVLDLLGHAPTWTVAERATYKRGSARLVDPAAAMPWERIVRELDATQEKLRAALPALTPEKLAAPLPVEQNPFKVDSLGDQLAVFHFHESYHMGQLGIVRRLLGKPGAIA